MKRFNLPLNFRRIRKDFDGPGWKQIIFWVVAVIIVAIITIVVLRCGR